MLVIVLLLVLAAGGVLVGAVTANHPEWAWLAVLLCAVGAALLVVERAGRRREASSAADPSATGDGRSVPGGLGQRGAAEASEADAVTESPGRHSVDRADRPPADPGGAPEEETADVADSIVVSEMDAEVVVVDEFPRYHLAACTWLTDRAVIPLPLREALELGFTPCARCEPDATLAAGQRAAR